MARQKGIRKGQRAQERQRRAAAAAGENGNGIGASSEVSGATERVTKSAARGTDTEDKTYTEFEVAVPEASGARDPTTSPEIPQNSSDQWNGTQDNAILRGKEHSEVNYISNKV